MGSRSFPIYSGDTVKLTVIGQSGDTSVDTIATLRSSTPIQATDIFGTGPIAVDQNYGGPLALAYQTAMGVGIVGATVLAYLTSDYNAGRRAQNFAQGRTVTIAGGVWQTPLMLLPLGTANDYTILFTLPGAYGPDTVTITV